MNREALNLLRCPNRLEGGKLCLSALEKGNNVLRCSKCGKEWETRNEIPIMREQKCKRCRAPLGVEQIKCEECGFRDRHETQQYLNMYHDAHFGSYILDTSIDAFIPLGVTEAFYQQIVNVCIPYITSESCCLDLGCAFGRLSLELAKRSRYVIGLDWSIHYIRSALKIVLFNKKVIIRINDIGERCRKAPLKGFGIKNCDFVVGDAQNIPFDDSSFDFVLCANLVDRVSEPNRMVDEIRRVLKMNGVVAITDAFSWQEEYTPERQFWGKDNLCDFLPKGKWEIKPQIDGIPFALRYNSRDLRIFYNQLVIARKV